MPRGFSLIELTLVLAIFSILSFLAFPIFDTVLLKHHRLETLRELVKIQGLFESCYLKNLSYKLPCKLKPTIPKISENSYFSLELVDLKDDSYTLKAEARGAQTKDYCLRFTLNETNQRQAWSHTGKPEPSCWLI